MHHRLTPQFLCCCVSDTLLLSIYDKLTVLDVALHTWASPDGLSTIGSADTIALYVFTHTLQNYSAIHCDGLDAQDGEIGAQHKRAGLDTCEQARQCPATSRSVG